MNGRLNLFQEAGILLILLSSLLFLGSEVLGAYRIARLEALTQQLESRLPPPSEGDPEQYSDKQMPVMTLDGSDFCALLQVPAHSVSLPVADSWEKNAISRQPQRFWGSVYDDSLVIGGSNRQGQLDFCAKLDTGDKIVITDMSGTQFSFEVSQIQRKTHADTPTLLASTAPLTLFTPDTLSNGYIIVYCLRQ